MAIGALRAARQLGRRVPDDLSIVGFGDIDVSAYVEPPLTTVRVPWREIGERLGGTLLDHLAGEPTVQQRRLPVDLVIRGSAGPARQGAR
jgi:DNA-binding LacI/PurR family transcriptional regulator